MLQGGRTGLGVSWPQVLGKASIPANWVPLNTAPPKKKLKEMRLLQREGKNE